MNPRKKSMKFLLNSLQFYRYIYQSQDHICRASWVSFAPSAARHALHPCAFGPAAGSGRVLWWLREERQSPAAVARAEGGTQVSWSCYFRYLRIQWSIHYYIFVWFQNDYFGAYPIFTPKCLGFVSVFVDPKWWLLKMIRIWGGIWRNRHGLGVMWKWGTTI